MTATEASDKELKRLCHRGSECLMTRQMYNPHVAHEWGEMATNKM